MPSEDDADRNRRYSIAGYIKEAYARLLDDEDESRHALIDVYYLHTHAADHSEAELWLEGIRARYQATGTTHLTLEEHQYNCRQENQ